VALQQSNNSNNVANSDPQIRITETASSLLTDRDLRKGRTAGNHRAANTTQVSPENLSPRGRELEPRVVVGKEREKSPRPVTPKSPRVGIGFSPRTGKRGISSGEGNDANAAQAAKKQVQISADSSPVLESKHIGIIRSERESPKFGSPTRPKSPTTRHTPNKNFGLSIAIISNMRTHVLGEHKLKKNLLTRNYSQPDIVRSVNTDTNNMSNNTDVPGSGQLSEMNSSGENLLNNSDNNNESSRLRRSSMAIFLDKGLDGIVEEFYPITDTSARQTEETEINYDEQNGSNQNSALASPVRSTSVPIPELKKSVESDPTVSPEEREPSARGILDLSEGSSRARSGAFRKHNKRLLTPGVASPLLKRSESDNALPLKSMQRTVSHNQVIISKSDNDSQQHLNIKNTRNYRRSSEKTKKTTSRKEKGLKAKKFLNKIGNIMHDLGHKETDPYLALKCPLGSYTFTFGDLGSLVNKTEDFESVFELGEKLGQGGFAEVCKAIHKESRITYVVKIINIELLASEEQYHLIIRELRVNRIVTNHKNLVKFYEAYLKVNSLFMVMEYCEKGSLMSYYKERGPLTEAQIVFMSHEVLQALIHLNEFGIMHRYKGIEYPPNSTRRG